MSVPNDLMNEVLARLRADPPLVPDVTQIRRSHRTAVPRENAPAIHVIQGRLRRLQPESDCPVYWRLDFIVRPMVRSDDDFDTADPLMQAVLERLAPTTPETAYQHSARLNFGDIDPDQEVADADALGLDMAFSFAFETDDWSLERGNA